MLIFDAIAYCFSDRAWPSKALATTLSWLAITPPIGYATRIAQATSRGSEKGLPEHDFATEFIYGLGVLLVALLYQIPTYLIFRLTMAGVTPAVNRLNALTSLNDINRTLGEINALIAGIGAVSLGGYVLIQFFGFFFWVSFVWWAVNDNRVTSFFDLPQIFNLIRAHPVLLISNYVQQAIAGFLVYLLTTVTAICICLPCFFAPFYLFVYGYATGKTAKALGLRARSIGEELSNQYNADI